MKNNMKHTSFFKALALFAFVFMAFACSGIADKSEEISADGKSYISIKVGESLSRTILSDAFDLNDSKMSFALAGYIGENKIVEKSWTSYQLMTDDKLGVEAGTYNFTLTATYKNDDKKTVVFEDTAENVVVESGKTTSINFTLKEKACNLTGEGSVNVTVKFPSDFGAVRAVVSLHDFEKFPADDSILKDSEDNVFEWEFGTAEYKAGKGDDSNIGDITSDASSKMSFQYKANLDARNYILKISFYSADGVTEIEPGYAEALEIRSGRISTKTIETDGVHSHTINTGEWSKDDDYHWHAASCGIESHNTDKAAHTFSKDSTDDLTSDASDHWHICETCGATDTKTAHTWVRVSGDATTRTSGTTNYKCSVCDATKTETGKLEVPASAVSLDTLGAKTELNTDELLAKYDITASSIPAKIESATYYILGVYPQTVKAANVTVDETIINLEFDEDGNYLVDYYLGSDNNWYAKCTENAYSSNYTYSDGTSVALSSANSEKYFKVEPIVWRKLGTSGYLLAEKELVANMPYYGSNDERTLGETTIYANNYKYSNIRAWLNGIQNQFVTDGGTANAYTIDWSGKGFLQTAFTQSQREQIKDTTVDNSAASTTDATGNVTQATTYACNNTNDKIFLLSELETTTEGNGFATYDASGTGNSRIRLPTDYAKANYAYQSTSTGYGGYWWLRSPYFNDSNNARYVSGGGYADYNADVGEKNNGVVPALNLIEN